jgi:hypothetical protein
MTARTLARLCTFAALLCGTTFVNATGISFVDGCGRSLGASITGGPPDPLSVDSSGNVGISGFSTTTYMAGFGVCDNPPSDGKSMCVLSASQTKVPTNTPVTLWAKCSYATSSVAWSSPAGGPTVTTNGLGATVTFPSPGSYTYWVTGSDSTGPGHPSAPVTILVGAPGTDKPNCQLSVSPQSILQGQTSTLRVTCQPEATSYAWDAAEAGAPAAPSIDTGTLTFNSFGAFTYKVAGQNAQGLGPKTGATIAVTSTLGCNPGPVTYDLVAPAPGTLSSDYATNGGVVYAFNFTLAAGGQTTFEQYTTNSPSYFAPQMQWSVSPCKGDFSVTAAHCNITQIKYGNMVVSTTSGVGWCVIQPGMTYYLNMKQTACSPSGPAGCGIDLYRPN